VAARIDAHILDCPSCRVFARDGYRALELVPFVPTAGLAERWTARIASVWERFGPEAAAGGGATATGAGALGASAVGTLKVAILCTTVVTAGVCGEQLLSHYAHRRSPGTGGGVVAAKATPPTHTQASATTRRAPTTTPRSASIGRRTVASSRRSAIPASAPQGSQEFQPSGSGKRPAPAPAPV
jgi:hypothetical protein